MSLTTALAFFTLITISMVLLEIVYTYATQGFGFGFSSNRGTPEYGALAVRIKRALQNQVESAAYIVPALAGAAIAGLEGGGIETAALLIIIGRAAFAILYYTGIPFVRVPAFLMATLPTFYLACMLVTSLAS